MPKLPHTAAHTAAHATASSLIRRLAWSELDPAYLRRLVKNARDEDLAGLGLLARPRVTGDRSTGSIATAPRAASANLVAREPLTVCGLPLIPLILDAYGAGAATVSFRARDGARARAGGVLATLAGDPRVLLAAERVILNFLQRLSGIATQTRRYSDALARAKSRTRLLDTRKTTPGHRMLEKYAVACAGGWNHRLGLFDRVMLKDNHLALLGHSGGLAAAISRAKKTGLPVEVEVDHPGQIPAVLDAGADVILLDNFTPAALRRAVAFIAGRAFTEASGGITLKSLPRLAALGLDFISTGALVHKSAWADIGLDWKKPPQNRPARRPVRSVRSVRSARSDCSARSP